jgi:hypothetical protein
VARNAWFGVALVALTAVAACGGEAIEVEAAAAAQGQVNAVRARTDSIRSERDRRIAAAGEAAPADTTAKASLAATTAPTLAAAKPVGSDSLGQVVDAELADSAQRAREIEIMRETFAYAGGARDPFESLINRDKTGPEVSDLDLVGIYMDLRSPSNNIVVLREKGSSAKRHKMRVGDQLGRARLVQIRPRDAVFTILDFGFERQETLSLRKQEVETP